MTAQCAHEIPCARAVQMKGVDAAAIHFFGAQRRSALAVETHLRPLHALAEATASGRTRDDECLLAAAAQSEFERECVDPASARHLERTKARKFGAAPGRGIDREPGSGRVCTEEREVRGLAGCGCLAQPVFDALALTHLIEQVEADADRVARARTDAAAHALTLVHQRHQLMA